MNELFDILNAIFGLNNNQTTGAVLARARDFHARFITRTVLLIIALLAGGFAANYIGWKSLNFFIAILFSASFLIIAVRPEVFLALSGLGMILGTLKSPESIRQETEKAFKKYTVLVLRIIFWIMFIFFLMGLVSIRNNPIVFFITIIAGVLMNVAPAVRKAALSQKNMTPEEKNQEERLDVKRTRRFFGFTGTLAFVVLVVSFLSLISFATLRAWSRTLTGYDIPGTVFVPETEQQEMETKMRTYEERILKGETLTEKEVTEYELLRKRASFWGRLSMFHISKNKKEEGGGAKSPDETIKVKFGDKTAELYFLGPGKYEVSPGAGFKFSVDYYPRTGSEYHYIKGERFELSEEKYVLLYSPNAEVTLRHWRN